MKFLLPIKSFKIRFPWVLTVKLSLNRSQFPLLSLHRSPERTKPNTYKSTTKNWTENWTKNWNSALIEQTHTLFPKASWTLLRFWNASVPSDKRCGALLSSCTAQCAGKRLATTAASRLLIFSESSFFRLWKVSFFVLNALFNVFINAVGEVKLLLLPKNAHNFQADIVYYLVCADNAKTGGI